MNNGEQFFNTSAAGGYTISRSVRFNSSDSAYLSRTPASAGNRKTWTWAGWVKRSGTGQFNELFSVGSNNFDLLFNNNAIEIYEYDGVSTLWQRTTTSVYRDFSAWYHIVLAYDTTQATAANRVRLYVNGTEITVFSTNTNPTQNRDGYVNDTIAHYSGRQAANNRYLDAYLADIHFIDGQALDPTSFGEFDDNGIWNPIEYAGTYGTNGFYLPFSDNSTAAALGTDTSGNGNDWTPNNLSVLSKSGYTGPKYSGNGTFTSGQSWIWTPNWHRWFDGDLTTFGDAYAYYGTSTSTLNFPTPISGSVIRFYAENPSQPGTGADVNGTTMYVRLNGQAAIALTFTSSGTAPNAVGWTDAISIPGSSLTQLIVYHSAPVHRHIRIYGVEVDSVLLEEVTLADVDTDSLVDVPTNGTETDTGVGAEVRGNYCTWNPLDNQGLTLTNGNLDVSWNTNSWYNVKAAIGVSTGKWYYEYTVNSGASSQIIGLFATTTAFPAVGGFGYMTVSASGWGYQLDGNKSNNGSFTNTGTTAGAGDLIMVAYDMDAAKVWFGVNGVWLNSGDPVTGANAAFSNLSGTLAPAISMFGAQSGSLNTGQRPFAYTAPSGFKALNTASLPAPTIEDPSTVMDVALYTGNGSTQTISGLGFSPDLVWIKSRSSAYSHALFDIVRGATKQLSSDNTSAEATYVNSFTAFNSDGFSVGSDAIVNNSSSTFAAWNWDAGSSTVSNNDGSITTSLRASPSSGFSVVSWSGVNGSNGTIGHGLGVAPQFVILKNRGTADNWRVYHISVGATGFLQLASTGATVTSDEFQNTSPTSTVFYLRGNTWNAANNNYVAYCFAPVAGYSAFGSYTGNGSTDGPFVYTGHRSRFVLIKSAGSGDRWTIQDTSRSPYNASTDTLAPNLSNAELANAFNLDILSNGFKVRNTNSGHNTNGVTYIWASFAENPFQYARAR